MYYLDFHLQFKTRLVVVLYISMADVVVIVAAILCVGRVYIFQLIIGSTCSCVVLVW